MADLEKSPTADVSVGKPKSGTYGEKRELEELKSQLPSTSSPGAGATQGPSPVPNPQAGRMEQQPGRPQEGPPGLPSALLHGTQRPNVPLGTPLVSTGQPSPVQNARESRVRMLRMLVDSDEVSEVTKQWAEAVLEAYGG